MCHRKLPLSPNSLPWLALLIGAIACGCTSDATSGLQLTPNSQDSDNANSSTRSYEIRSEATVIGQFPTHISMDDVYVSFDGQHFWFQTTERGRLINWVDFAASSDDFHAVSEVRFSETGGHYAYVGYSAGVPYLVHDGESTRIATGEDVNNFFMSDDGKQIAADLQIDTSHRLLFNGELSKPYAAIRSIKFGADPTIVAFIGVQGPKETLVVNGEEILTAAAIDDFELHPTTHEPLVVVVNDEGHVAVYGDQEFDVAGSGVASVSFSPNGDHYVVTSWDEDEGHWICVDGTNPQQYDNATSVIFSADGTHYAYGATDQTSRSLLIVDGQSTELSEPTKPIGFLNNQHLVTLISPENGPQRLMAGDQMLQEHSSIQDIELSPAATHVTYFMVENDQVMLGVDSEVFAPCQGGYVSFTSKDEPFRVWQSSDHTHLTFRDQTIEIDNLHHITSSPSGEAVWVVQKMDSSTIIQVVQGTGGSTKTQIDGAPFMPGFVRLFDFTSDHQASLLMNEGLKCSRVTITLQEAN